MKYWLMKSEPDVFSFDDLLKSNAQITAWEGVRNYQARNFMRDLMKVGDAILFYHSSTKIPGVAGMAEVASKAYPDASQFNPKSDYFDPGASLEKPRWFLVDVRAKQKLTRLVRLEELKAEPKLASMRLLQRGNRLSITPLSKKEFDLVVKLAEQKES